VLKDKGQVIDGEKQHQGYVTTLFIENMNKSPQVVLLSWIIVHLSLS